MKDTKIAEYKNSNELELEKIINEYSGYVYKIVTNMAHANLQEEDIEEVISDTFFILWKNKEKLKEEKSLSPYIAGITKNLTKEKLRSKNKEIEYIDCEENINSKVKLDLVLEEREVNSAIENIIKNMNELDIKIFKMYYYSAMKTKEISAILKLSEINVRSRLYRIRKKLKNELIKGGYNYGK